MKIAILGTGNVGGALAGKWAQSGHTIYLGVRNLHEFKGKHLLNNPNTEVRTLAEAVALSDVVLLATPAQKITEILQAIGSTENKVIIDAMNNVGGANIGGFTTTTEAILHNTQSKDVVKCFNTTGYNNMINPNYGNLALDMFVAGDSAMGKQIAAQLAVDAGFAACYDIGGNNRIELLESFAKFWINLAMTQGHGREIGFKLLMR